MNLTQQTNEVHDRLQQALQGLVEAQYQMLQITQQGNMAFTAAIAQLVAALAAPRTLITDGNGNPIGVASQPQQPAQGQQNG